MPTLEYRHRINGLLTDATSVKLAGGGGSYGVRTEAGELVVAANTEMERVSTGVYQYTFEAPAPGLTYKWNVAVEPEPEESITPGQEPPKTPVFGTPIISDFTYVDQEIETAGWQVIEPPTEMPVTWEDVNVHLRLEPSSVMQPLLDVYIYTAVDFAEQSLSAVLSERTIRATFAKGQPLILPRGPLLSIVSVIDSNSATPTYRVKHQGHRCELVLTSAAAHPIAVTYRAGYRSPQDVPASIRTAILQHIGTIYRNRESVSEKAQIPIPHSLKDFYALHRRTVGVG